MPLIVTRSHWTRQPQGPVPSVRSLRGLRVVSVHAPSGPLLRDAVDGAAWSALADPGRTPGPHGLASAFNGSSQALSRSGIPHLPTFSWFGRVWLGDTSSTAIYGVVAKHGVDGGGSDWTLYRDSSRHFVCDWPWIVNVFTTSGTWSDNQWVDIALIRAGSPGAWTVYLFVNGVLAGSGSTSTNPNTAAYTYSIGAIGFDSGTNFSNNRYAYAALLEGAADASLVSAMRDPWQQIWPPSERRIWVPSAGGAFNPAWASAANSVISSGARAA